MHCAHNCVIGVQIEVRCDISTRVYRSTHLVAFSVLESSMLYASLDEAASAQHLQCGY
jgi:hypothetical protein